MCDRVPLRIQLVTAEVRVVAVVDGSELLRRGLAGRAGSDGRAGITHELHRHVAGSVVADFARWSCAEPVVGRSVRERVDDALESPGPDDGRWPRRRRLSHA